MKLRIRNAVATTIKNVPCMFIELNRYDFEKAKAYNDRDLEDYTIEIAKPKRSNDQNRYMWELISKIAEASGLRENDIYRHAIREAGAWFTFRVAESEYKDFCKTWEANGVGWWVEEEVRDDAGIMCRAYRGSSGYNSLEMSKIIDWIIDEAKWWNIETDTPEQIARRKATWNGQV